MKKWTTEDLNGFPKVTEVVSYRVGTWIQDPELHLEFLTALPLFDIEMDKNDLGLFDGLCQFKGLFFA